MDTKEVKIIGVKGVFCGESTDTASSRISINLDCVLVETDYPIEASLTLWKSDDQSVILGFLEELGFVGDIENLMEWDKDTDSSLFFPKLSNEEVLGEMEEKEGKEGKIYKNIVSVGKMKREVKGIVNKAKFLGEWGFIQNKDSGPKMS